MNIKQVVNLCIFFYLSACICGPGQYKCEQDSLGGYAYMSDGEYEFYEQENWETDPAIYPPGAQECYWDWLPHELQKIILEKAGISNLFSPVFERFMGEPVLALTFNPEGDRMASGSSGGTIEVWDTKKWKPLKTLKEHGDWVEAVAFNPEGNRMASGSYDGEIKVWDAKKWKLLGTLQHSSEVRAVAFNPAGDRMVSGSRIGLGLKSGEIKIWDAKKWELLGTLEGHDGWVRAVAFNPTGDRMVSGADDARIKIWDATNWELLKTLKGHDGWVRAVAFNPAGDRMVSGADDARIKIWDATNWELLKTLEDSDCRVTSIAFNSAGDRMVSGSRIGLGLKSGEIKIWDAKKWKLLKTLKQKSWVNEVTYSSSGKQIVSGLEDKKIKILSSESSFEEVRSIKINKKKKPLNLLKLFLIGQDLLKNKKKYQFSPEELAYFSLFTKSIQDQFRSRISLTKTVDLP